MLAQTIVSSISLHARRVAVRIASALLPVTPRFAAWTIGRILGTDFGPSASRDKLLRFGVHFAMSIGAQRQARALLAGAASASRPASSTLATIHGLCLDFDWETLAMSVESTSAKRGNPGDSQAATLASTRLLANGDPNSAWMVLSSSPNVERPQLIGARAEAALRSGRIRDAVHLADAAARAGGRTANAVLFDAYWQLGDRDAARNALERHLSSSGLDAIAVARVLTLGTGTADESDLLDWVEGHVGSIGGGDDSWRLTDLCFELGLREQFETRLSEGLRRSPEHPDFLFGRARADYVDRHFEASMTRLRELAGTRRSRDAAKLQARIAFETGQFVDAERARSASISPRGAVDEVLFFAILAQHRYSEAFRLYLDRASSKRLEVEFGAVAGRAPIGTGDRAAVINQDGPGDELIAASLYSDLSERFGAVTATCDPRLAGLMRRSFPSMDFVPTTRQSGRLRLGLCGPGAPRRAIGGMYGELNEDAAAAALGASQVMWSRSLWTLRDRPKPTSDVLRADPLLSDAWRSRISGPAVGVVWRSEFSSPMRSIHFVKVADLAPLARQGRAVYCLQHDATDAERRELVSVFGENVRFLDDVDLRDDFEQTAAILCALDSVIGPGTTIVELAAALGVRTICLQPNYFGMWRSIEGRDFWRTNMVHACATNPPSASGCVTAAAAILDGGSAPGLARGDRR